ncbi:cytochrome [Mycobacteroides sp. H001]|uniref:cytochrome P450 n=1 Tax=Mycobacteroides TaxID=670516 RepID=UPI000715571E|nr:MULTISPECIES: cytochrome P450 [Mycobacteroides]KRQ28293.1 cytochrome [Mycobacteroides sp. H072]KRQ30171.1 cytochrome [Mycobacteroides sp. H002]KRQ46303.1 cytochrome [Mycobacteroides sp. H054]KRQ68089.1 cytochrome [Mycobacteroides sp. H001]OHU42780.1 cytochrome [Mycobacteroides chelonae]
MSTVELFDPQILEDPYPFYRRLRETAPVWPAGDSGFYFVSRWDLVVEATERTADFSSNLTAALMKSQDCETGLTVAAMGPPADPTHVLATGDDPVHHAHRKLVLPTLVAKRITALEPVMAETGAQLWERGCDGQSIDWMAAMGDALPMTMVARLIGLPDEDVPQLVQWGYSSTEMLGGLNTAERQAQVVTDTMYLVLYLREHLEKELAAPGEDLLGYLAQACNRADISLDIGVMILVQLVGAGGESTAGLMGNAVRILGENSELQQRIRDDRALLPTFLEEVLRLESPFRGHHRHVVADTSLGGVQLPAGSHLTLLWGAANRDPEIFENPDELRLDRPSPRSHITFGKGLHFCVGAALARLEARTAINLLLDQTREFTIKPGGAQWVPSIMVRRHQKLELELSLGSNAA